MMDQAGYIVSYLATSITMVVLNKSILGSKWQFGYPFLLLAFHMFSATVITQVLKRLDLLPFEYANRGALTERSNSNDQGKNNNSKESNNALQQLGQQQGGNLGTNSSEDNSNSNTNSNNNRITWKVYTSQIVPIALLFSVSLITGNNAMMSLSISFIQMLKSSTPICVLILSITMGLEQCSKVTISLICILTTGVIVSTAGEQRFNWTGLTYQMVSIIAEALRLTLSDKLLKEIKIDALSLLYYVAPLSFMGILLGFAVFEAGQFHENDGLDRLGIIGEELHTEVPPDNALDTGMGDTGDSGISHHGGSDSDMPSHGSLLLILGVSSLTAFACNVCSMQLIASSSAVILSLVGVLKDLLILFFSVLVFQSPVTLMQMASYLLTLVILNVYKEYKKNPLLFNNGACGAFGVCMQCTSWTDSPKSKGKIDEEVDAEGGGLRLSQLSQFGANDYEAPRVERTSSVDLLSRERERSNSRVL